MKGEAQMNVSITIEEPRPLPAALPAPLTAPAAALPGARLVLSPDGLKELQGWKGPQGIIETRRKRSL